MAKEFVLEPSETEIRSSLCTRISLSSQNGHLVLTNKRLLFCGSSGLLTLLLGPIMQLLPFMKTSKRIITEIMLSDITGIEQKKHGLAQKIVVSYGSSKESFAFTKKEIEGWVAAIEELSK